MVQNNLVLPRTTIIRVKRKFYDVDSQLRSVYLDIDQLNSPINHINKHVKSEVNAPQKSSIIDGENSQSNENFEAVNYISNGNDTNNRIKNEEIITNEFVDNLFKHKVLTSLHRRSGKFYKFIGTLPCSDNESSINLIQDKLVDIISSKSDKKNYGIDDHTLNNDYRQFDDICENNQVEKNENFDPHSISSLSTKNEKGFHIKEKIDSNNSYLIKLSNKKISRGQGLKKDKRGIEVFHNRSKFLNQDGSSDIKVNDSEICKFRSETEIQDINDKGLIFVDGNNINKSENKFSKDDASIHDFGHFHRIKEIGRKREFILINNDMNEIDFIDVDLNQGNLSKRNKNCENYYEYKSISADADKEEDCNMYEYDLYACDESLNNYENHLSMLGFHSECNSNSDYIDKIGYLECDESNDADGIFNDGQKLYKFEDYNDIDNDSSGVNEVDYPDDESYFSSDSEEEIRFSDDDSDIQRTNLLIDSD